MAKSTFSSVLKRLFSIFSPHTCNSSVPIVWSELHGANGTKAEKKGSNDELHGVWLFMSGSQVSSTVHYQ
jgi:hypothetical protein